MADIFISYHENSAGNLVQRIAKLLEAKEITCWYAKRNLHYGGDFSNDIPREIDTCKLFLLVLNEKACQSKHVQNEVGLAFGRYNKGDSITILPVQIGDFILSDWIRYYLVHIQITKIPLEDEVFLIDLIQRISTALGRETETESAAKPIERGSCGDNASFILDSDGVLTISGNGPMRNFAYDRKKDCILSPWWEKRTKIVRINIKEGITAIGEWAFSSCSGAISVSIPNSVTKIGDCAFNACTSLTSVIIPENVTNIGAVAFSACNNLEYVQIPDSVIRIKRFAFSGCARLTNVCIPKHTKVALLAFPLTTTIIRR